MSYRVDFSPAAVRDLDRLPEVAQKAIAQHIRALCSEPRPRGALGLAGKLKGHYRVRVGQYRVAYEIDDQARVVHVWQIGPRRGFYERALRRR